MYSSEPLYYCYKTVNLSSVLYYYTQIPMTYVGQSQSLKAKSQDNPELVSSSSQLTYTSSPVVVTNITSNGFIDNGWLSVEYARYKQGDLYT